jgi:thiosulfate reductase cytochrome b subunit
MSDSTSAGSPPRSDVRGGDVAQAPAPSTRADAPSGTASATPALASPARGDTQHGDVAAAPRAHRPAVKRHHWIVRVTHWVNAVVLVGMMASGLQIYGAFPHFGERGGPYLPNPLDGERLPRAVRLGGWLAGGLNWHFTLAWPLVIVGVTYLAYLAISGEWRALIFRPRDVPRAVQMQLYYMRLRKDHPPQGKHNALQKGAYNFILALGAISVLSGFAIYKPVQLGWLTWAFGGYELARYWHFAAVWLFAGFIVVHVLAVFLFDLASLPAMITGWYRGRFTGHE